MVVRHIRVILLDDGYRGPDWTVTGVTHTSPSYIDNDRQRSAQQATARQVTSDRQRQQQATSVRQRQRWQRAAGYERQPKTHRLTRFGPLVCFFHLNLSLLTIFLDTNYSTNSHNERQATTTMENEQLAMSQRATAQNTSNDVFWAIGMFYILFSFKSFLTNYVFKY